MLCHISRAKCAAVISKLRLCVDGVKRSELTSLMLCLLSLTAAHACVHVCRICARGHVVAWSYVTQIIAIVSHYKQSQCNAVFMQRQG